MQDDQGTTSPRSRAALRSGVPSFETLSAVPRADGEFRLVLDHAAAPPA
jgi:hypothetical protein